MALRGIATEPNALRQPLVGQVEATCTASADAVYAALADLPRHLEWGGRRQKAKMRLLTLDAPSGLARVGTEFASTGSNVTGGFADRSVVTEARPGRSFEFVTEAVLTLKQRPVEWTLVHRYEIAPRSGGGSSVTYHYRVTRISALAGPLRMLKSPFAGLMRAMWRKSARRGLRALVAEAQASSTHRRTA